MTLPKTGVLLQISNCLRKEGVVGSNPAAPTIYLCLWDFLIAPVTTMLTLPHIW